MPLEGHLVVLMQAMSQSDFDFSFSALRVCGRIEGLLLLKTSVLAYTCACSFDDR